MAAGDFSKTKLQALMLKVKQFWADGIQSADYISKAEAAVAVAQNTSARFRPIYNDVNKRYDVEITWIDSCAIVDQDCVIECDWNAPEVETNKQTYTPTLCRQVKFSIDATKFQTNTYDLPEVLLQNLSAATKRLDEWIDTQVLLKLKANMQYNADYPPYTKAAGSNAALVPADQYNLKMLAEVMKDTMVNDFGRTFYINDGGLWAAFKNAQLDSGNGEGKGDNERRNEWDMYFDMFGFARAGLTENLFAVNSSSVAIVSVNENPTTPDYLEGDVNMWRWRIPSQVIPGIEYDVYQKLVCTVVGNKRHYVWKYMVEFNGDVYLNPQGCSRTVDTTTYKPTGILGYQVAPAA